MGEMGQRYNGSVALNDPIFSLSAISRNQPTILAIAAPWPKVTR